MGIWPDARFLGGGSAGHGSTLATCKVVPAGPLEGVRLKFPPDVGAAPAHSVPAAAITTVTHAASTR